MLVIYTPDLLALFIPPSERRTYERNEPIQTIFKRLTINTAAIVTRRGNTQNKGERKNNNHVVLVM